MHETLSLTADAELEPAGAGKFYEVIDGRVVEPPEMGAYECVFANAMAEALILHFARAGRIGRVVVETIFRIDGASRLQRRPDVAFISYDRWPRDRRVPRTAAWAVVPDLAIEVISPGDLCFDVLEKLDHYFGAGVRQVWVIYPRHGRVFVHDGPKRVTVLDATDTLDGGDILPGFRLRLGEIFEEHVDGDDDGEGEGEGGGGGETQ
jgi:Uma2 family endonuclease